MSGWYFEEAVRLIEVARSKSGESRRKYTLRVIWHLIAYVVGRQNPQSTTATTMTDEPMCDLCFKKVHGGLEKELCVECESAAARQLRSKHNGKLGKHASAADHPEHEGRIRTHKKHAGKELRRLGLNKPSK